MNRASLSHYPSMHDFVIGNTVLVCSPVFDWTIFHNVQVNCRYVSLGCRARRPVNCIDKHQDVCKLNKDTKVGFV